MPDSDAETRGGDRPADWKTRHDLAPEELPKGGEPGGVPPTEAPREESDEPVPGDS